MNSPLPPINTKFLLSDGTVHPDWIDYFSNLHLQVSQNFGNDGYIVPTLTNTVEEPNITLLEMDPIKSKQPRIVHNTSDGKYYVNILSTGDTSTYKAIETEP